MSRLNLTWRFAIAVGSAIITGMAVAALLVWQLNTTRTSYDDMLSKREVQHQDRARVVQLTFKKQVQEWKNLLLRGFKYDDFQKYEKAFKTEEAETRKLAQELLQDVSDPEAREEIQGFLTAHEKNGPGLRGGHPGVRKKQWPGLHRSGRGGEGAGPGPDRRARQDRRPLAAGARRDAEERVGRQCRRASIARSSWPPRRSPPSSGWWSS
jgi:hypothetical protein